MIRSTEEILKIRPGARMEDDGLGWAHERSGQYSVRSSYRLLKMEQSERETDVANEPSSSCEAFWWRKLWKLKIPPKIRIFWWRSIHNYLPSKQELKRRHVTQEDFCEVCGMQGESIYHIAFDCTIAKRFWQATKEITGVKLPELRTSMWAKDLLAGDCCSDTDAAMIICGVWSLWSGRNARRHGRDRWDPNAAVRHVAAMLEDMMCLETTSMLAPPRQRIMWKKPPLGWMKVNIDAAFVSATGDGAGGAVVRNSQGEIMMAAARFYKHLPDVLTSEALAARDGMMLAQDLGVEQLILELDNSTLVALLWSEDGGRCAIAGLWQEIRERSRVFRSFDISFVNREGNEVAHLCASKASASFPLLS